MSFESQAKTTRQVIDTTLGTENWDLEGLGITDVKVDFEKPLWVSLEDAQKAIKVNYEKDVNVFLDKQLEVIDLKEKLANANKILSNLLGKAQNLNYYINQPDIRYTMRQDYKWLSEYDLAELKDCLADKQTKEPGQ